MYEAPQLELEYTLLCVAQIHLVPIYKAVIQAFKTPQQELLLVKVKLAAWSQSSTQLPQLVVTEPFIIQSQN